MNIALEDMHRLAEEGNATAQLQLGEYYSLTPEHAEKAYQFYCKAAASGLTAAQYKLGLFYLRGHGTKRDEASALYWLQKAASRHHLPALFALSRHYGGDPENDADCAKSMEYTRQAAEKGHAQAQYHLGLLHQSGLGGRRDTGEAVRWFRKAASQHYAPAEYALARLYCADPANHVAYAQGMEWYRAAASHNHADAQFQMGEFCRNRRTGPEDETEALRWYRSAADQRHAAAMFRVACCLRERDETLAWHQKAQDAGYYADHIEAASQGCLASLREMLHALTVAPDRFNDLDGMEQLLHLKVQRDDAETKALASQGLALFYYYAPLPFHNLPAAYQWLQAADALQAPGPQQPCAGNAFIPSMHKLHLLLNPQISEDIRRRANEAAHAWLNAHGKQDAL